MPVIDSQLDLKPLNRPRLFWVFSDTWQLAKRSLLHIKQDPDQLLGVTIQPIMFIVLFRYVFGGAINTGGESYVNFLMAGIFVQTTAFASTTTSVSIATDLREGIIDRFRSLPMVKSAVISGHIFADLIRSLIALAAMIAAGLLVGFRPHADALHWLAVIGLLLFTTLSFSWIGAIIGLLGKSVEFVQQAAFIWLFPLTFASSAFVPTSSMPKGLRAFAVNQPITQIVDAIRGLLLKQSVGNHVWVSIVWLLGILVVSVPITAYLFRKRTS